jgi:hypothetical protein
MLLILYLNAATDERKHEPCEGGQYTPECLTNQKNSFNWSRDLYEKCIILIIHMILYDLQGGGIFNQKCMIHKTFMQNY